MQINAAFLVPLPSPFFFNSPVGFRKMAVTKIGGVRSAARPRPRLPRVRRVRSLHARPLLGPQKETAASRSCNGAHTVQVPIPPGLLPGQQRKYPKLLHTVQSRRLWSPCSGCSSTRPARCRGAGAPRSQCPQCAQQPVRFTGAVTPAAAAGPRENVVLVGGAVTVRVAKRPRLLAGAGPASGAPARTAGGASICEHSRHRYICS